MENNDEPEDMSPEKRSKDYFANMRNKLNDEDLKKLDDQWANSVKYSKERERHEKNALIYGVSSFQYGLWEKMGDFGQTLLDAALKLKKVDEFKTLNDFEIYSSLAEIFKELDCLPNGLLEAKLTKPSNLSDWQSVIYRCSLLVKILKTLNSFIPVSTDKHNFIFIKKRFYKSTTWEINYDAANLSFVVKSGLAEIDSKPRNKENNLYDYAQYQLHQLITVMKTELPKQYFERAFNAYILTKNKSAYHISPWM